MADIKSLLQEKRVFKPDAEFARAANWSKKQVAEYRKLGDKSPQRFWAQMVKENVSWFSPWKKTLDWKAPFAKWFVGAKTNVSYNCLDRHLEGENAWRKNKAAIIWEGEPGDSRVITYAELHREVCRFANVLKARGVKKKDRVILYMPMVPEVISILYGCFKVGAVAVPIFSGFGVDATATRLEDPECSVLFTADGFYRRGSEVRLKPTADEAIEEAGCVENVVVYRRFGDEGDESDADVPWTEGRDEWWGDTVGAADVGAQRTQLAVDRRLQRGVRAHSGLYQGAYAPLAGLRTA